MADFTFFTNPMSRGQIARWAFHEVHADYEQVLIDWGAKPAALLQANPLGKVPTIIHHSPTGDHVVTECAAICAYLADIYPHAGLGPTPAERADYYRWLFFAAGPLEQAATSHHYGFVPNDPRASVALGFGTYEGTMGALEGHLSHNDFVCGSRFTMADVYVGSQVDWGLMFKTFPQNDAFNAYAERCRERAAYKEAKAIDGALIEQIQAKS